MDVVGGKDDMTWVLSVYQVKHAVEKLEELAKTGDHEIAHIEADAVLMELVPDEVKEAYNKITKWYS